MTLFKLLYFCDFSTLIASYVHNWHCSWFIYSCLWIMNFLGPLISSGVCLWWLVAALQYTCRKEPCMQPLVMGCFLVVDFYYTPRVSCCPPYLPPHRICSLVSLSLCLQLCCNCCVPTTEWRVTGQGIRWRKNRAAINCCGDGGSTPQSHHNN